MLKLQFVSREHFSLHKMHTELNNLPLLRCEVFLLFLKGIPFTNQHSHGVQGIPQNLLHMIYCKFLKDYDSTAA